MKKVFAVELISRSVQTKLVYASSKEEADEIASGAEWNEKEIMLDSETKVREAVINGEEKEGDYPDFYPSDYVWLQDDKDEDEVIAVRYEELTEKQKI